MFRSNNTDLTKKQSDLLIEALDMAIAEETKMMEWFQDLYRDNSIFGYAVDAECHKYEIYGLEWAKQIIRQHTKT